MSVARFWRKIPQRYNMLGTKCETCGRHFFPPRTFCPDCRRAGKIVDYKFIGSGTIVTYSVIHTASEQYEALTPYVIAIVKLDEGPQITTQIVCRPDQVKIGMKVKSVFRKIATDGASGIIHYGTKFVPVE
jgi:uncharacterized OB-fold protein